MTKFLSFITRVTFLHRSILSSFLSETSSEWELLSILLPTSVIRLFMYSQRQKPSSFWALTRILSRSSLASSSIYFKTLLAFSHYPVPNCFHIIRYLI
jgi:hypothetical protein